MCFGAFYLLSLGSIVTLGARRLDSMFLPYNLLYGLPLGNIARTPVRFLFVVSIATAILAAWGFVWLQCRWVRHTRGSSWPVAVLLVALVAAEGCPAPRPVQTAALSPFYTRLARSEPGAVLALRRQLIADAMYAQTAHGHPIVGGYVSRHAPEELRNHEIPVVSQLWFPTEAAMVRLKAPDVVQQAPLIQRVPDVLHAHGIRSVVLDLDAGPSNDVARLRDLLAQALGSRSRLQRASLRSQDFPRDSRRCAPVRLGPTGSNHSGARVGSRTRTWLTLMLCLRICSSTGGRPPAQWTWPGSVLQHLDDSAHDVQRHTRRSSWTGGN